LRSDPALEVWKVSEPTTSSTLGAREIAERVAAGELSAREAVEEHVRRIEEANPRLNAVVVPLFDHALGEADAADAARSRGEPLGPLHGVPVTIKEQFLVADTPTTVGLTSRASHRAVKDGPLVGRLRRAGAIVVGKTNVSQLLIYHESDNPVYGRTNNPWDPVRTPGEAAAGRRRLSRRAVLPSGSAATTAGASASRPTSAACTA
jgi:Asp-tRNA(Asn)/Glu-tRNA(Gln) amidotransferase A subunit family amidase